MINEDANGTPPSAATRSLWSIAYGDYELIVDRRALTYQLTETKTGTIWADSLSLGWVALESRETGEITRHDFGSLRCVSVSEKAGPQGKRILFGLDLHGVPIDFYLICSQREIQIQVEANRDSKTYKVAGFGILPDLCTIPNDEISYLVIPIGDGAMAFAQDAPETSLSLPIWDFADGLTMPFVGAVRKSPNSAIALITDSAYGGFGIGQNQDRGARLNLYYSRDPERRRLDVRVVIIPNGDHVSIARAYREKLVQENNHITLRRKMRERPLIELLIGSMIFDPIPMISHWTHQNIADGVHWLRHSGKVNRAFIINIGEQATTLRFVRNIIARERSDSNFLFGIDDSWDAPSDWSRSEPSEEVRLSAVLPPPINAILKDAIFKPEGAFALVGFHLAYEPLWEIESESRWRDLERRMARCTEIGNGLGGVAAHGGVDWSSPVMDMWIALIHFAAERNAPFHHRKIPLYAVVYHDSVMATGIPLHFLSREAFLRILLNLSLFGCEFPAYLNERDKFASEIQQVVAVIAPLHQLTFSAFLTTHRFLTPDFKVEEAIYSDKTRVVINQSERDVYETPEFALPPLGFYVRHSQMEAHDALRVGDQTFPTRAWRIRRARDGKPLETSEDVIIEEFPSP